MKTHHLVLWSVAAIQGASAAFGFAQFARGDLRLSTTASASYDSRILGGIRPADDFLFSLHPELLYNREAGQVKLQASAGVRANRYHDFRQFDSEDFGSELKLTLPPGVTPRVSGSLESRYQEQYSISYDVNVRVRERALTNRVNADISTGLKTSVLLGGSFARVQRDLFSDRDTWDGTAAFKYFGFLGNSALELRYRHLEVESSGQNALSIPLDQQSDIYSTTLSRSLYGPLRGSFTYGYRVLHRSRSETISGERRSAGSTLGVNIDGPFLPESLFPKLESSFSIGYQESDTPGLDDPGSRSVVGAASIKWNARSTTRVTVELHRSLQLSIDDRTVLATGGKVGLNQDIGRFTLASFSAGFERRAFRGVARTDDVLTAQALVTYRINPAWSASADYLFRSSDSRLSTADYDREVVTLSGNYTF